MRSDGGSAPIARSPHPPLPSRPSPARCHGRSSHGTAAPDKSSSRDSVPYLVWMQQKGPRAPPDSAVRVRQPRGSGLCFAVRPPARASVAGVIASLGQSGADERPHPSAAPEATLPGLATKAANVMDDRALCVISWGAWATEIAPAERRRRSRKIEYLIHFLPLRRDACSVSLPTQGNSLEVQDSVAPYRDGWIPRNRTDRSPERSAVRHANQNIRNAASCQLL